MTIKTIAESKRTCQVEECPRKYYAKDFCKRHYEQFRMKGETFGDPFYSHKDMNRFRVEGDICKIELRDRRGHFKCFALVDVSDLFLIRQYKWGVNKDNLVTTRLDKKTILFIYHLILGFPPEGLEVDHDNRNRLDNRRCNLRYATSSQNNANVSLRSDNTSGFKGVRCMQSGKYQARIGYENGQIHLGMFEDKTDAAQAYNEAALKLFGEFACLNPLTPSTGQV